MCVLCVVCVRTVWLSLNTVGSLFLYRFWSRLLCFSSFFSSLHTHTRLSLSLSLHIQTHTRTHSQHFSLSNFVKHLCNCLSSVALTDCSVSLDGNPCEAALSAAGLKADEQGWYSGAQLRDYNKVWWMCVLCCVMCVVCCVVLFRYAVTKEKHDSS